MQEVIEKEEGLLQKEGISQESKSYATGTDAYRKLQQHLDQLPVGFPATKSGVEMRLLKRLFTPEEARIATYLSYSLESIKQIYARAKDTSIPIENLERILDAMFKKGTINFKKEGSEKKYGNALYVIGWYEQQVKALTSELFLDHAQFCQEGFASEMYLTRIPQLRVIPIEKSIIPEHHVSTYDELRWVVENSEGPICVTDCICRKGMDIVGSRCRRTQLRETCIYLGSLAQMYIDRGVGRPISRQGALEVLRKAEEDGLILEPQNAERPEVICCCCGDCCGILTMVKAFPRPVDFVATNHYAEVDPGLCTACGTCLKRCQMSARKLVNYVSTVNRDRCIGCGVCVPTCASGATRLSKKEKVTVPAKNSDSLYTEIMNKKNEMRQKGVQSRSLD
nr:4Fe-4S binding protein [Candidatus Njordarchaeum guaymaensis]